MLEDTIKINNQKISFEELFNKKIDYSLPNFSYLKNKTVLITGGAGSIGKVLLKYLLKQDINKIIVLDHSEFGIFKLGLEFRNEIEIKKLILFLGDIRNLECLNKIFTKFEFHIIYHAAAYKHIDILENNVEESISVNTEASLNILKYSKKYKIEQLIFISTDKAVNPVNKMGISKRITELYLLKEILSKPSILNIKIVRFGNVFNSRGSVFDIFKYQIQNKLPITLTSEKMKRYFISKFQAVKGLIQITDPINKSGIYLLNMGDAYKIHDILSIILKKLKYTPQIIKHSPEKKLRCEKLEEELLFCFENIEAKKSDYNLVSLKNYNLTQINTEITYLSKLLKN